MNTELEKLNRENSAQTQEVIMRDLATGSEVMKKPVIELDGFSSYTNEIEGDEDLNVSGRVIQGVKIKFLDPRWLDNNGTDITGKLLTAIEVVNVVSKWGHDNKPIETRFLAPGEKFPNFAELNAKCDKSEWRERFGKMVGPWSGQHVLYFIDEHVNRYTWPSPLTTIGSAICVREFTDQVKLVRRLKGLNLYAVTELSRVDYPTGYGLKQRPYLLRIKKWVKLGPEHAALPAPDGNPEIAPPASGGAPADAQSVAPPTTEEELGDSIPF